jgi:hypothetical protein
MRGTFHRAWIIAGTLLSIACGEPPSSADEASSPDVATAESGRITAETAMGPSRDSAGVRIVEWDGEPDAVATLRVEQLYVHGQAPNDYSFGQFGPSALLGDGRAAVVDVLHRDLLVVSADGTEATILARRGEGPGDLGAVRGLWTAGGDTIWFQDGTNARFVRFVADTLDTLWSTEDQPSLSLGLRAVGADPSGAVMLTTSAFSPRFDMPWLPGHMARYDVRSGVLDTVATYDLAPRTTPGQADPFSPFGEVTVAGGRWVETRSDRAGLTWRDSDGTVAQILRWNPEPTMPVEQDWLDFVAGIEENIRRNNPGLTDAVLGQLMQQQAGGFIPRPRQPLPHFFSPVGDQEGRVWLPEYMPDRKHPRRYRLVAPDGGWLGVVEFPSGTIVMAARGDRVLGRVVDELGVQSLVVYRLEVEPL